MNILKKFFSFSVGTWVGAIIGFVTIPIITNLFSPDDLGKASMFALALNVMLVLTMFGIEQTFVRFYYEEETDKLLRKSLLLTTLMFIIVIVPFFILRKKLSMYLFDEYVPEMMILLGFATIISVLNSYAVQIIRMYQKGLIYSFIQVSIRLFELVFILVLLLFLKRNYTILVYAKTLALFIVTYYAIYVSKKVWSKIKVSPQKSVFSTKDIFLYSYPLAITMLITWAFQSFDKIALKEWSTLYELGIYTAAFRIVLVLQMVQTSFTTYWIPLSYERFLKHNNDLENKIFFSKANSAISVIMLLSGVGLIMSKELVTYILGSEYKAAVSMIPCLVLIPVLFTISESTVIGINFHKKVKTVLLISVLTLLSNIIGNFILVPLFKGIGAAIAGGISAIIFFILRTHLSLKFYYVDFKLLKFYLLLALVSVYAILSTFVSWNIFNLISGCILLILIAGSYYSVLKGLFGRIGIFS